MKLKAVILCLAVILGQICFGPDAKGAESPLTADDVITKIENRYSVPGFSARFIQESTLKAMEITDIATGKMFVKRPGMMRWEYEKPEKQVVVTDGESLWIYRPGENQVMVGKAPEFFGTGKGATFLSDIRIIRRNFSVSINKDKDGYIVLELLPKEKKADVARIYISILKRDYEISRIGINNSYGDVTVIDLFDSQFVTSPDSAFRFTIPKGVEVIRID
ncbi:MAG: outer membrane lipoprotein carrier protein LolA [Proteobacteria bacterium]|nr:outer membrane lipoprotein carrier protein LolA [Pseudomonadota bacterium]MBU1713932.1 outer membrane lipoprotein carrier protein LolA [Pseudomonadota bacterium]